MIRHGMVVRHPAARWAVEFVFWLLLVGLIGFVFTGCSAMKSLGRHGATGGAAAAGAGVGLLVGPIGAIVGAGIASASWAAIAEAGSLSDGDTMSREQFEQELERWRGKADTAAMTAYWASQATDDAEARAERAQAGTRWYYKLMWWAIGLGALYFVIRNRAYLFAFGPGYVRKLWHMLVGGKSPTPPVRIEEVNP